MRNISFYCQLPVSANNIVLNSDKAEPIATLNNEVPESFCSNKSVELIIQWLTHSHLFHSGIIQHYFTIWLKEWQYNLLVATYLRKCKMYRRHYWKSPQNNSMHFKCLHLKFVWYAYIYLITIKTVLLWNAYTIITVFYFHIFKNIFLNFHYHNSSLQCHMILQKSFDLLSIIITNIFRFSFDE